LYCPVCRDEFRSGFTRCRACDVDLVERLDAPEIVETPGIPAPARAATAPAAHAAGGGHENTVTFCGFLTIEDARHAKAQLGAEGISAEILIKDGADAREEFWLRVKPSAFRATQELLGYDESTLHEEDAVLCSACETLVPADGERCPNCGARFEEA
jgi:hypothetical protein